MRNPEKTDFNREYFSTCNGGKPMSLKDFSTFWSDQGFIGDPKNYYTLATGVKLTKKKENESNNT